MAGRSGPGHRGPRRRGGGSFAVPFGRKPYGAAAAALGFPGTGPHPVPAVHPGPAPAKVARPSPRARYASRRVKDQSHRAGLPRIVRGGRGSDVKGTRRSFLTAPQKGSPGPTLERRSLCRPGGPDDEGQAKGQARSARGKLLRPASIGKTGRSRRLVEDGTLK